MEQRQYKVAAYCRLSRDDENIGESGSITVQKEIIRQYCEQQEMVIHRIYQDDGYSGLNYDRPGFQQMLADIESGDINCVITKDLSRLGRDYIMTGFYTEVYFPEHNVRYIAISDGYDNHDNASGTNEYAPFKFIMNDMYARDLSKKQRASRHAKNLNGEIMAPYAPFGYRKDPERKNHWIIDEETGPVVQMIFQMYADGMGRGKLREYLNEQRILTPSGQQYKRGEKYYASFAEDEEKCYQWSTTMIAAITKNEAYLGNAVHYRCRKANHKSRMRKQKKEDQLVVEGTHEPLVDKETWDRVQKWFQVHPDRTVVHENIFMGITRCADCGKALNFRKSKKKDRNSTTRYLICATYNTYGKARCTIHYTNYRSVCEVVKQRLNRLIALVKIDENRVREQILREKQRDHGLSGESADKKISAHEKRLSEISRIYAKLYEDRALDIVSNENFLMLSGKLQSEQKQLSAQLDILHESVAEKEKSDEDVGSFMEAVRSMEQIEVLDEVILNMLVDQIYIGERETREDGQVYQRIDIHYKFVGRLDF